MLKLSRLESDRYPPISGTESALLPRPLGKLKTCHPKYYPILHTSASGPDIGLPGRIIIGKASKSALRPAEGRPETVFHVFSTIILPKSGPEARFPARNHS